MKTLDDLRPERLAELVAQFDRARVAVIGDYFLDKYFEVERALAEPSVETGKTAHQVVAVRHSPGAAGTVVSNLAALGVGAIEAIGLTGDDGEGFELRQDLAALGCGTRHLYAARELKTPTYLKPRDCGVRGLAGEHSRYDTKNRKPTPGLMRERMVGSLQEVLDGVDAVIALDQVDLVDSGVVTREVREALASAASHRRRVIFWADSRRRIHEFRGLTIKANQFEVLGRENPMPGEEVAHDELFPALARMRDAAGAAIFATLGAAGMLVTDPELTLVRGVRVTGPTDPTGAGDSATAGAVLALAAGATPPEAALVGNLVASITVQQLATTGTARPEELLPRLTLWREQGLA